MRRRAVQGRAGGHTSRSKPEKDALSHARSRQIDHKVNEDFI